jgi:DnaK suppressor protein
VPDLDPPDDILVAARVEAALLVDELRAELSAIAESTQAVPDDEHDAEGSTVGFERARDTGLLKMAEESLGDIEGALDRRRAGAYGRCERCGERIDPERLAALPATVQCRPCATLSTRQPRLQGRS